MILITINISSMSVRSMNKVSGHHTKDNNMTNVRIHKL